MKEKDVYDAYQERSVTAGTRAGRLAWMMVVILCGALIGNQVIASFLVGGALALVFCLLSVLQSLWQAVGMWIVKQRMKPDEDIDDYPNWLGFGAWVFYLLKMVAITIAVVYFAKDVFCMIY